MRIVVAMSGGVDSSVAAYELKKQGHDVIGITIKTWPKEECGAEGGKLCCSLDAIKFARSVAEDLKIPYYVIDLSKEFAESVQKYFVDEYARGRTPSPCIYCNSRIKFGRLFEKARELGAEKIATGHFARILKSGSTYRLVEAEDLSVDQSYFLYDISSQMLPFIEFPVGTFTKKMVRSIAQEQLFMSADRQSSQDICFVSGTGGYRKYLTKLGVNAFAPGKMLDVTGKAVGEHKGIAFYTVGQRRHVGVSGPEPLYVLKIDPKNNTITIGQRAHAMKSKMRVGEINWLTPEAPVTRKKFGVRIRHRGDKASATVILVRGGKAVVEFDEPQFAPAPGQAAVFYEGETLACGAWIEEVLE